MKTDKVNLEFKKAELQNMSNNLDSKWLLADGISFNDFMNQQLAFTSKQNQLIDQVNTLKEGVETKIDVSKPYEIVSTQQLNPEVINNNVEKNKPESDNSKFDSEFADDYLKLDLKKLSQDDVKQIQQLLATNNIHVNINQINGFNNSAINYNSSGISYKSLNVSKGLSEMLAKAYKTNKPVRIDFDNKSSVILKIDREGKLSAQFLSSDKAMEMMLRDNIHTLRYRLDDQGLPYKELTYKQQDSSKQERESKKDK